MEVKYNIRYRRLPGRHCCIYNSSTDMWQTFNAAG